MTEEKVAKKSKFRFKKLKTKNENEIAMEVVDEQGKTVCKMRMCENLETGDMDFVFGKGCPKGTIERLAGKIATRTLHFRREKEEDKD